MPSISLSFHFSPPDGGTIVEAADLSLPAGLVEDSARGEISVIGWYLCFLASKSPPSPPVSTST